MTAGEGGGSSPQEVDRRAVISLLAALGLPSSAGARIRPSQAQAIAESRDRAQSQMAPVAHYSPIGDACPSALVMVAGGFLIPSFQYDSYGRCAVPLPSGPAPVCW